MSRRSWTWWGECSGAAGDLGILLPLASALAIAGGFGMGNLIFLWGLAYIATGFWYRVPVSVQPLKAMAVIAIAQGIDASTLSNAAVGYGVLFVVLAMTGTVERIRRLFSPGLVRGVQLGIGLVLVRKAFHLAADGGGQFGNAAPWIALATVVVIVGARRLSGWNLTLPVIAIAVAAGAMTRIPVVANVAGVIQPQLPSPLVWGELFVLLMLPQLPLTLGNAVVAANDACHEYWPDRADRVSSRSLATSIGVGNIGIGLLGGFPMCHGAGGIAAHHRFGGQTGRTTIILGAVLVIAAAVPGIAAVLLRIPVPVLAGLLLIVAWEMARLVFRPAPRVEVIVALVTGLSAIAFGHLALGLAVGWVIHHALRTVSFLQPVMGGPDGNHPRH